MKINFIKQPGGVLVPSGDLESDQMHKFKTGEMYEVDIKKSRNPQFLAKVMIFFEYCQAHWDGDKVLEHGTPQAQFDRFRKDMTILAGYYDATVRLNGDTRIEAKSLSYGSMSEDEFQECYQALIQVAMKHIFKGSDDEVYNKLVGFF